MPLALQLLEVRCAGEAALTRRVCAGVAMLLAEGDEEAVGGVSPRTRHPSLLSYGVATSLVRMAWAFDGQPAVLEDAVAERLP